MNRLESVAMRRIAALALLSALVVLACGAACTLPTSAHAFYKGQKFTVNENQYVITDYERHDDDAPEVKLVRYGSANRNPDVSTVTYRGTRFEVETIGKNAFNNAHGHKITSLKIGRQVDEIGSKAFYGCKKLKTIDMRVADVIDLDRTRGGYRIDDIDIGRKAFSKAGTKSVKVRCGRADARYRSMFKRALMSRGMRSGARVVK